MGLFSSIGHAIKGIGHVAGKVLSNPIVQTASAFIPGVGPLVTAGEGALGGLLKPGGNLGSALSGGIQGGLAGAAGGNIRKLGTGILSGGLGSTIKGIGGGTLSGMLGGGGSDPYGNITGYDDGGFPIYAGDDQGGGGWQGTLRKLGSGILNGAGGGGGLGGLGNLAVGGLAGYQAINAANASKRAGQLSDQAINLATQRWNDAAPLRNAGQARLLNPVRPDLTSVYQDTTNPFATRPAAPSGGLDAMLRQVGQPPIQGSGGAAGLIRRLNAGGSF